MERPLSGEQLAALESIGTCRLADAIETFGVRLRNQGYTTAAIRACTPAMPPVIGYAATAKIRGANPRTDGHPYHDRTGWWTYLLSVPAPRFVVIEDVDETPGAGAFIGAMHAAILQKLGCVAVATNGAVRDVPEIERLGLPLFAGGLAVSHAYAHLVDFGEPVRVAGLDVSPGDLLHADRHGVLSIPIEIAADLPAAVAQIAERERRVLTLCSSPGFTLPELRTAITAVFD